MTTDQLTFQSNVEQARHNAATEQETMRSNMAKEAENARYNTEYIRTNKSNEKIKRQQNKEQRRSNKANEALKKYATDVGSSTADKDRASREQIAESQNETNKYIAQVNAAATKYAADAAAEAQRFRAQMDAAAQSRSDTSKEQIAEADRLSREIENSKDRAAQAAQTTQTSNIDRARNDIEELKAKIQQSYNENKIAQWQYEMLMTEVHRAQDRANTLFDNITSIMSGNNKRKGR